MPALAVLHQKAIARALSPDVRWLSEDIRSTTDLHGNGSPCIAIWQERHLGARVMKILIVDDHPLFRAGFHAVLEQSDLDAGVLSVSSVPEALQALQRDGDIGLVLLDIHLRGEDGFNALKLIGERFPTTACIMISGDEQEGVAPRADHCRRVGLHPQVVHRR